MIRSGRHHEVEIAIAVAAGSSDHHRFERGGRLFECLAGARRIATQLPQS